MDKPLINYINDEVGVNYAGILDFLKDLQYHSPEHRANYLAIILLTIEATEKED